MKLEKKITRRDAEKILALLSTALNADEAVIKSDSLYLDIDSCSKLKLAMKIKKSSATVKLRCYSSKEHIDEHHMEQGEVKYKTLKKGMKKSFEEIEKHLEQDLMPPQEIITKFLTHSAIMTAMPDYGDEYYNEYEKACEIMKYAFEKADMTEMKAAFREIKNIKEICHKAYK